jgi:hypothetical protein
MSNLFDNASVSLRTDIKREFDPGSGRTLAACLTHASRAKYVASLMAQESDLKHEVLHADLPSDNTLIE